MESITGQGGALFITLQTRQASQAQRSPQPQTSPSYVMPPERPKPSLCDAFLALTLTVTGFLFWEWELVTLPFGASTGIGATLFFLITIALSCAYLYKKGIRPTPRSLCALGIVLLGALPFALYGARSSNAVLVLFECAAAVTWITLACKTTFKPYLSGFLVLDTARQLFFVPFRDYFRLFVSYSALFAGRRVSGKARTLAYVGIGLLVAIPVLALVTILLGSADDSFQRFIGRLGQLLSGFKGDDLLRWISHLLLGVPLACYLFGLLYGSCREALYHEAAGGDLLYTQRTERGDEALAGLHKIPRAALYAPLICFVLLYLTFFIVMGSYLFSAWQGELPSAFTYAEYARRGFFELCAVASINLALLAAAYLFASRAPRSYPRMLKVITGVLSACTCLLIATAISKMILYIQTYGLSPLRLYTLWFMLLLAAVFLILVVWHVRPFNAARPVIWSVIVFTLVLGLCNTNGLIANYNVDRYLAGQTEEVDVLLLKDLSVAAVPALQNLEHAAGDEEVREQAGLALQRIGQENLLISDAKEDLWDPADLPKRTGWTQWNVQAQLARNVLMH